MAGSQTTGTVAGIGVAAVDLLNYFLTPAANLPGASHFPMPQTESLCLVAVGGYAAHVILDVLKRFFPSKPSAPVADQPPAA